MDFFKMKANQSEIHSSTIWSASVCCSASRSSSAAGSNKLFSWLKTLLSRFCRTDGAQKEMGEAVNTTHMSFSPHRPTFAHFKPSGTRLA